MGVAIIGMGPREIPDGIELWGMPWDDEWTRFDRQFEIHHPDIPTHDHKKGLDEIWVPLYMQEAYYPNATRYPLEEVIEATGDYFSCSISYMLGLAILEEHKDIEIHGVTGDETYGSQKPGIEYMIGIARGKGINVNIHGGNLMKQNKRYGYI